MTKIEFIDARTKIISEMLDNPDEAGIYPTSKCFAALDDLFDQLHPAGNTGPSWAQIETINPNAMPHEIFNTTVNSSVKIDWDPQFQKLSMNRITNAFDTAKAAWQLACNQPKEDWCNEHQRRVLFNACIDLADEFIRLYASRKVKGKTP